MKRITLEQKAAMADCSCPLPSHMHRPQASKKMYIIPIVIFAVFVYIVWALFPPGAWLLLALYLVIAISTMTWRALKGHSLKCVLTWGPVAALYTIADAVLTGI